MADGFTFRWPADWEAAFPAIEKRVRSVCYRYDVSRTDAEEIDATVKERLWLETQRFHQVGKPILPTIEHAAAWAGIVATRLITRIWKSRKRMPVSANVDLDSVGIDAPHDDFEDSLSGIKDARKRDAVRLKILEGYTLEQIAEQLKVSTATAYNLFHSGAKELLRRDADGKHRN